MCAATLATGCEVSEPSLVAQARAAAPDSAVEVSTARVRRGTIGQWLAAPGSLVARRESRIGAEVRGPIERIFVSEGDRVEADDPLFQIDREPYETALRRTQAGLDLARAERRQLKADLGRARVLHDRAVVSEQEIDRLSTRLEVARAREHEAQAAVALAEQEIARTLVRAPYAASVAERLVDEGTTALTTPQTIVLVLQETAELEARATLPETHLSVVRLGDRALIHVEGLPQPIATEVLAVGDTIDPATRTYRIRMRVPNPDHRLKAGVFAHIKILPRPKSEVLLIPRAAIRSEDGRAFVLTPRDGRAEARPIRYGILSDQDAEVLHGLQVGEQVVVGEAARTLAPGMRVRVLRDVGDSIR